MINKAIIADAGFGSRFLPISKAVPKAMLPLLDKPIVEWVILECLMAGISEFYLVTNAHNKEVYDKYFFERPDYIKNLLEKQNKLDRYKKVEDLFRYPSITILVQDERLPYGSASPVVTARKYVENSDGFIMCQSDDVVVGMSDASTMVEAFSNSPVPLNGIIMGQQTIDEKLVNFGVIKLKEAEMLDYIVERPAKGTAPSNLVSYGRYLLTPKVYDFLDPNEVKTDGEFLLVDAITKMAKDSQVKVVSTKGKWVTTGDPINYLQAQIEFALNDKDVKDEFRNYLKSINLG